MSRVKIKSYLSIVLAGILLLLTVLPPAAVPFAEEQTENIEENSTLDNETPTTENEALPEGQNDELTTEESSTTEIHSNEPVTNEPNSKDSNQDESTSNDPTTQESTTNESSQQESENNNLPEAIENNDETDFNQQNTSTDIELMYEQVESIPDTKPFTITIEAKNAEEVTLYYRTAQNMETKRLPMKKTENDHFEATIQKDLLWSPHFEYSFEAKNGESIKTLPEDLSNPFHVNVQKTEPANPNTVPPFLITEMVPDTTNVDGKDGYEFIEIYNNTDQPVNFKGYKLHYQYPGTTKEDIVLEINEDIVVESQKTVTIWMKNSSHEYLSLSDFNQHYGVNLTSEDLVIIPFGGLANSGERAISLYSQNGEQIVTATYNHSGRDDTKLDQGIFYQYPVNENNMHQVGLSEKAEPGNILEGQVPKIPVTEKPSEPKEEIEIIHTPVTKIDGTKSVIVEAEIKNAESAQFVYRTAAKMEQKKLSLKKSEGNVYSIEVPVEEFWSPSAYYRIEATGANGQLVAFPENEEWINVEVSHQKEIDFQQVPPMLITEIVPDTTNVNGKDGYEFIEIYNNTNEPINMKDYKVIYRYPKQDGKPDLEWDLNEAKLVQPQKSFVIWIHNSGNGHLDVHDFNAHYGKQLNENEIVIVESAGMANGSERTIVVADDFNQEFAQATYNDQGKETAQDQGIVYQFETETKRMKKVGRGEMATPADILLGQVPSEPAKVITDKEAPVIEHKKIENVNGEEDLTITAKVTDNKEVKAVTLFYKLSNDEEFKTVTMESMKEDPTQYAVTITSDQLWNNELIYYVEASDGINRTKTEQFTIHVEQPTVDYQKVPQLLITEVVPDSTNVNGLDGYEFIEVYNNTNQTINLKDYKIRYRYPMEGPEADLKWGPAYDDDLFIQSGETMVFWVINKGNSELTVQDFNDHYGTNLTEHQNIVKMYNNGMANSSTRSLLVATNTGKEISIVHYNDEVNVDDTKADKGILYKYPTNGRIEESKISSGTEDATPGKILPHQVPKKKVELTLDNLKPRIDNLMEAKTVLSSDNLRIKANIQDNKMVKTAELYYRTEQTQNYKKINLEENYNSSLYEYVIYSPELIGREFVEYYFKASDGTNTVTSETYTVQVENVHDKQGLRLNVEEGQIVAGEQVVKATSDTEQDQLKLLIDGVEKTDTFTAMETEAYFAFDVRKTNLYFQNGITMGDDVLRIFDDTINTYTTITVPIPANKLNRDSETVISIRSGTKVSPFDETSEENRDDFYVKNVRLVLSDGTVIYDPNFADVTKELSIGDGASSSPVIDFSFSIPNEKFKSLAYLWDTTSVHEGTHIISTKNQHNEKVKANVVVDNSPPQISTTIEEGKEYKGPFTIDVKATDRFSQVEEVTVKLDDDYIEIPFETSSALLAPGEHELTITAKDTAGNTVTEAIPFKIAEEHPYLPDWIGTDEKDTSTTLSVKVTDPTSDKLNVSFYEAYQYTVKDQENVRITKNIAETEPPASFFPEGEVELTDEERQFLIESNGKSVETTTTDGFPYHRFDVEVDQNVDGDDEVEVVWKGSSLNGRKVTMYAWNYTNEKWVEIDSVIAGRDSFTLKGTVKVEEYVNDQKVSVIVQDQLAKLDENYDYTFVWMSDTQYYSESYPHIYENQVQWIADNQESLNIQYVFHTGDLVDEADDDVQWDVADRSMKVLEDANIPYGVLAGNHDVGHKDGSYDQYYNYFGESRFADQSYFAGSYKNNRGHYDLMSVDGNDFIMVYMGWGVSDEDLDWMNEVLRKYPNRKAILAFHEYLLVSGNRSPTGNKIFENVVKQNENVIAVLSGHYHDSEKLVDEIDDNGDGVPDRKVYQMLADYQGGPEGGQGYLRLLHFNQETNEVSVKTYSPYLDDYNYYDPEQYPEKDEFTIQFDLEPKEKKVETDYFELNVYTNNLIGKVENVPSGETATVTWNDLMPQKTYYWYAIAEDQFGGKQRSDVWSFLTKEGVVHPPELENPDRPDNGDSGGSENETDDKHSNNNGDQSGHDNVDNHDQNGNSPFENETNKPIENVSNDKSSTFNKHENLPNTATTMYNWLLLGISLLLLGVIAQKMTGRKHLYK